MSQVRPRFGQISSNRTNLGLFKPKFTETYLKKSQICPIWCQSDPIWMSNLKSLVTNGVRNKNQSLTEAKTFVHFEDFVHKDFLETWECSIHTTLELLKANVFISWYFSFLNSNIYVERYGENRRKTLVSAYKMIIMVGHVIPKKYFHINYW